MGSAGYGNHDAPATKVGEDAPPAPVADHPRGTADRPTGEPDDATPGAGSMPDGAQGNEVDPGAG